MSAASGPPTPSTSGKPPPSTPAPASTGGPKGSGEGKKSGNSAKNDAKAQKAARRAEKVAAKADDSKVAGGGSGGSPAGASPGSAAAGPGRTQQDGKGGGRKVPQGTTRVTPSQAGVVNGGPVASSSNQANHSTSASTPLSLFLHLDAPPAHHNLRGGATAAGPHGVVHPAVVRLAQMYAEFKVVGANARCIAMLEAFKEVIRSYTPPVNTSLSRHLPTHLSPQISYLVRARPLSISMGNAIRYLKSEITLLGVDVSDEDAKALLCERIDHFVRDRIVVADKVIEEHAISKIRDGDVIMTYARSSVVQGVFLEARRRGLRFSVVLVDSRPMYEGRHLLRLLTESGISCTYVLLSAISSVLPTIDLLLLGTHALLSNGAMYARAGTAMVAMMAKGQGVPVVCCCETYKFTDRIMLDSIVSNEMGTTQTFIPRPSHNPNFPFPSSSPSPSDPPSTASSKSALDDVSNAMLNELSLLYDVSRPEDVTMVITEAGMIPVQSVPVLHRDYKPLVANENA